LKTVSAQFGEFNFDGRPVDPSDFSRLRSLLVPYGPDREGSLFKGNFGVLYRAFDTTPEARRESQPFVNSSGITVTLDGRLDNRDELLTQIEGALSQEATDVEIVAAVYELWGTNSCQKLIGDWALSIWDPLHQTILLARDFIGTRHLYYSFDQESVTWSTILNAFLLLGDKKLQLEEEYIAGWLSFFPESHLTPFVGIHSVPPACVVQLRNGIRTVTTYWHFNPHKKVRYSTDSDYEEHFRSVFAQSVRRRLRSDTPVIAELSGGMDSSSIVCMADLILSGGDSPTPQLQTVSYYDDSEPNWNERPYFSLVEEKRGRRGCHIEVSSSEACDLTFSGGGRRVPVPGLLGGSEQARRNLSRCLAQQGNRVLLSGIGGDEIAGGVPTATQELADLLSRWELNELAHKLKLWALAQRRPWFHLLGETVRVFLPAGLVGVPELRRPAAWVQSDFAHRHRSATRGYEVRWKILGALPSFQDNVATIEALRRQLTCDHPSAEPFYEERYPFLDRDLLEFLFAVPREQLVRPGQRRSLMRRALTGIVPDALLNRRRKAYVARGSLASLSRQAPLLASPGVEMVSAAFGMVDSTKLANVLEKAHCGQMVPTVNLIRTLQLEQWLRTLIQHGVIDPPRAAPVSVSVREGSFKALRNSAG
jgi:asparagine synthase (glutamine-hydrolysing)